MTAGHRFNPESGPGPGPDRNRGPVVSTDTVLTRLRAEYPGWSIVRTDAGHWWATRGPLVREHLDADTAVDADTSEQLTEKLQAVNRAR